MPQAAIPAIAAPIGGALVGDLLGGSSPQASQAVPPQLQGLNTKSIQGLMTLLGFGGPNPWAQTPQGGAPSGGFGQNPQQGPTWMGGNGSGAGGYFNAGGLISPQARQVPGGGMGAMPPQMQSGQMGGALQSLMGGPQGGMAVAPPTTGMQAGMSGGPSWNPGGSAGPINGGAGMSGSPMDQIFGNLGQPLTQLQQQSLGGMGQFLSQTPPEMQALQQSMPMLQNLLGNNPGAPVISALKPFMQQGLDMANQQGGRFGSANALRQSQVMNDYGLLAAQAAQQGVNQQLQGANQLGILSSAAGQNPFSRMLGGFNAGQSAAGQNDVGLQRALQLMGQGAFGQPTTVSPSGLQQGASMGGQIGAILAMLGGGGMGGGQGAATNQLYNTPGYGFGGFGG